MTEYIEKRATDESRPFARRDPQLTMSKCVELNTQKETDRYTTVTVTGNDAITVGADRYQQHTLDFGVTFATKPFVMHFLGSMQENYDCQSVLHSATFTTALFGFCNHSKNVFEGRLYYQVTGSVLTSSLVAK